MYLQLHIHTFTFISYTHVSLEADMESEIYTLSRKWIDHV